MSWREATKLIEGLQELRLRRRVQRMTQEQLLNSVSECGNRLQEMTRALYRDLDPTVLAEGQLALTGLVTAWMELTRRANE